MELLILLREIENTQSYLSDYYVQGGVLDNTVKLFLDVYDTNVN